MSETGHRPGARHWTIRLFGETIGGSRIIDFLVLGCVVAAFLAAVKNMGGASPQGTEWPARWLAAGLALHAHAIHDRAQGDRCRLRLLGALPLAAAAWLLVDSLIHPASAWKAHEAAATATLAATALWLTTHHTRHAYHRKFIYGVVAVTCAGLGTLTLGNSGTLLTRFAGRTAAQTYAGHATGPFGTPGEFTALMLVGFFLSATHALLPRRKLALNISSGYLTILAILGLYAADTTSGRFGIIAGCATFVVLRFRHVASRALVLFLTIGAAWLVGVDGAGRFGLLRIHDGASPLPAAAIGIFQNNPWTGVGSGGFAAAFEAHRPACWTLDPDSAGGLFHTLLAEHGVAGILMITLPLAVLAVLAWRHLARLPLLESSYDRQFDKTTRFTPDEPLAFIAVLSATAACTVALALDCARTNTAVVIALAMAGGTVIRELKPAVIRIPPATSASARRVRLAALVTPCVALPLATISVLKAQGATGSARDMLSKLTTKTPDSVVVAAETKRGVLDLAGDRCETALRLHPTNAEAQNLLARVIMTRFRMDAQNTRLGEALALAAAAESAMPGRPEIAFTRVELLRIHGRFAEAAATVDRLYAAAPNHPDARLEYVRTHISEPAKHADLLRALEELLRIHPENAEALRLRRIIRLAGV